MVSSNLSPGINQRVGRDCEHQARLARGRVFTSPVRQPPRHPPAHRAPRQGQATVNSQRARSGFGLPNAVGRWQQRGRAARMVQLRAVAAALACLTGVGWLAGGATSLLGAARIRAQRPGQLVVTAASSATLPVAADGSTGGPLVRLTAVAPLHVASPLGGGGVSWGEVLHHMARRLEWTNSSFHLAVHDVADTAGLAASLASSKIAVVLGVTDDAAGAAMLPALLTDVPTVATLGSGAALRQAVTRLGGRALVQQRLWDLLPWSRTHHQDAEVGPGGAADWAGWVPARASPLCASGMAACCPPACLPPERCVTCASTCALAAAGPGCGGGALQPPHLR